MTYTALTSVQATDPGDPLTAAWCDAVHENFEFLIDPPAASISDVPVSVANNTLVVLGATGTENFDNDSMHSDSTNRSRMTIQTAGRYLFLGTASYANHAGNTDAYVRVSLRVDGTTSYGGMQLKNVSGATQSIRLQATRALVLNAAQYVEMTTQHILGSSFNATLDELLAMFVTR